MSGMNEQYPISRKRYNFRSDFHYNTRNAKIQGLSIQAGELFADLYRDGGADATTTLEALAAYKSLRRLLPRSDKYDNASTHMGSTAAHKSTQGF